MDLSWIADSDAMEVDAAGLGAAGQQSRYAMDQAGRAVAGRQSAAAGPGVGMDTAAAAPRIDRRAARRRETALHNKDRRALRTTDSKILPTTQRLAARGLAPAKPAPATGGVSSQDRLPQIQLPSVINCAGVCRPPHRNLRRSAHGKRLWLFENPSGHEGVWV